MNIVNSDCKKNYSLKYSTEITNFNKLEAVEVLSVKDDNFMADFAYVNFRKQLRLEGILPSKGSLAKHRKFLNTVQEIKTDNNFGAYIDIKTKLKQI